MQLFNEDCLDALKRLEDDSIELIVTDPPYDIKNTVPGKSSLTAKISKNMKALEDSNICGGFNLAVLDELVRVQEKINMYFFCNKAQIPMYFGYFLPLGCSFDIIKWVKTNPMPAYHGKYVNDTEYCMYFRKGGLCMPQSYEDSKTLYQSPINTKDKKLFLHPTCKPMPLVERVIRNSSKEGQTVLDPYMGSGTTGRAAKLLGRRFIGMEINKKWFSIAESRIKTGLADKDQMVLF
jgi:site-specific DNA-methyltransferase (adenine-specific)